MNYCDKYAAFTQLSLHFHVELSFLFLKTIKTFKLISSHICAQLTPITKQIQPESFEISKNITQIESKCFSDINTQIMQILTKQKKKKMHIMKNQVRQISQCHL